MALTDPYRFVSRSTWIMTRHISPCVAMARSCSSTRGPRCHGNRTPTLGAIPGRPSAASLTLKGPIEGPTRFIPGPASM